MKKAFTLIELLVVVVVIVSLMSITFRLSSIGSDSRKKTITINRLNRLENCLSGYYAAYGSYPPVKVHGTRNIYARANSHGIQSTNSGDENTSIWGWSKSTGSRGIGSQDELTAWRQVRAACRSQPLDAEFPFPKEYDEVVSQLSDDYKEAANQESSLSQEQKQALQQGFDDGVSNNIGRHDSTKTDWREVQLFKFGLMSFLLPRYLVMMHSEQELFYYKQWTANNELPSNPLTGQRFTGWQVVHDRANDDTNPKNYAEVSCIPSQAVTARWLPNLEKCLYCSHKMVVYGLDLRDPEHAGSVNLYSSSLENLSVYSPGGFDSDSSGGQYVLARATMLDGWDNDFYYYSPSPHQTYTIWSSGPNGRTFPPWVSRKNLDSKANECVSIWTEDDIVRMTN